MMPAMSAQGVECLETLCTQQRAWQVNDEAPAQKSGDHGQSILTYRWDPIRFAPAPKTS